MNDDFQRILIGKDFAIIGELNLPVMVLETSPVAVSATLGEAGDSIYNARYRLLRNPDEDDDGFARSLGKNNSLIRDRISRLCRTSTEGKIMTATV